MTLDEKVQRDETSEVEECGHRAAASQAGPACGDVFDLLADLLDSDKYRMPHRRRLAQESRVKSSVMGQTALQHSSCSAAKARLNRLTLAQVKICVSAHAPASRNPRRMDTKYRCATHPCLVWEGRSEGGAAHDWVVQEWGPPFVQQVSPVLGFHCLKSVGNHER